MDALPGVIGEAVREVEAFVQCPPALAACSALSVVSLAGQGLANVRRGWGPGRSDQSLLSPIAGSGERKSECDRRFAAVLRAWEAEQAVFAEPEVANYRAALAAWEAEREGVLLTIKHARKAGESTEDARSELARLERDRPTPVRIPRLLLESETQESLAWNLARPDGWPLGGLLSSEAGIIFGGHSMRDDSRMRTLALLQQAVERRAVSREPPHLGEFHRRPVPGSRGAGGSAGDRAVVLGRLARPRAWLRLPGAVPDRLAAEPAGYALLS